MDNEGRVGIKASVELLNSAEFSPFSLVLQVNTMADAEDLAVALGGLHSPFRSGDLENPNRPKYPVEVLRAEIKRQKARRGYATVCGPSKYSGFLIETK